MWNVSEMVLTGDNRSNETKGCAGVTLHISNLTRREPGGYLNGGGEGRTNNSLPARTDFRAFVNVNIT